MFVEISKRRLFSLLAFLTAFLTVTGLLVLRPSPGEAIGPNAMRPFGGLTNFAANDDLSVANVALGFTINFFGTNYSQLHVNNNGNVTFDLTLSTFTPFALATTNRVIIAPFFGDVDTRGAGSALTQYGQVTVAGRPAFTVTWNGVGCFSAIFSVLNHFQVNLIDRSDVAPGDFDIEFNYDQIQWETGQASGGNSNCLGGSPARMGWSSGGVTPTSFEQPGSGVAGAFLDANATTGLIHNRLNTSQNGRYIFTVRGGVVVEPTFTPTPSPTPTATATATITPTVLSEPTRVRANVGGAAGAVAVAAAGQADENRARAAAAAQPAATVVPPRTGTGVASITPPSTGEAGLLTESKSPAAPLILAVLGLGLALTLPMLKRRG